MRVNDTLFVLKTEPTVEQVADFWDTEACGTQFVADFRDERDFYAQYRRFRYETEWHIPEFVPFRELRGHLVLVEERLLDALAGVHAVVVGALAGAEGIPEDVGTSVDQSVATMKIASAHRVTALVA